MNPGDYSLEDFKVFLPHYLSDKKIKNLMEELKSFPKNIDQRLYSSLSGDFLAQGDCVSDVPIPDFENNNFVYNKKAIIISNTCDISKENKRLFSPYVTYCPIFSLCKYRESLLLEFSKNKVENHITAIKKQMITQILYLPKGRELDEECFARLDMVNSLSLASKLYPKVSSRLSSFSDYGFYMFLFKISIHFTRIQENITRNI